MSKKIVKIIICTILINFLFLSIYSQASNQNIDDIFGVGQQFINTGEGGNIHFMDNQVINSVQDVGGLFSTIGTIIIVCVVLIMGIKYMLAKPDDKAKLKKQLIGIVISAGVILFAYFIWSSAIEWIMNAGLN